jgi:acyl-CoA thioesterase FadM
MGWRKMNDVAAAPLCLHRARVRPEWVDYNRHMNEAYYVLVFGDATDAFYDYIGLDDAFRRREEISIYTVEAHIRYLIEAPEGEALEVATRVLGYDSKRLRLHHSMARARDGAILAVTEISALHVDKRVLKACPFHAEKLARIAAIARAQAAVPAPVPAMSSHWATAVIAG